MPEMPETWQHAVNHWLDVASAFSGLSISLGYGVLVLALPLLLLPTAFPELSRPRDALWSLPLAALAPLLLLNRLPVFSSAGLGELIATVLMARLAAEVGQGRWESLTPDQKEALRHLPRWRRAGADLVAAVVQAAKATWSAIVQAGKAVRGGDQDAGTSPGVPDVPPAMEAGSGPAADNAPDEDAATGGSRAATPEQEHRTGTGLVAAVVQAAKAAWGAVSGQKGSIEERQQRRSAQKSARKEWVRPDPSDGAQEGDQDGGTSSGILDMAPAMGASLDPAVDEDAATDVGEEATPEQGHPNKPTADGPVMAVVVDDTPEEPSAPEVVEEPQQAQPVDGDDLGDGKSADAVPEVVTPETVESSVEPLELEAQPSEGVVAAAVDPGPEPSESVAEEPGTPEAVEEPQQAQPPVGLDNPKTNPADPPLHDADNSAPVDVMPEGDPGNLAAAGEGGEGFVAAKAEADGVTQEMTDASGAEAEPAQPVGHGPTQPAEDGDVVVSSFDEVDGKLRNFN